MIAIRSLFRHFKLAHFGAMIGVNLVCLVPFVAAFVGPLVLKADLSAGLVVLLSGFVLTGQAVAVAGRVLDVRFRGEKPPKGGVIQAWAAGWAEGLVVAAVFLGVFSLVFQSVPFYWSQGTPFAMFSLMTLGVGTLLVLGLLPYYLPARRREGLGLGAALARSFRLMNAHPLIALGGFFLSLLSVLATLATLGLFPGFAGLAALHQGLWDHLAEKESSSD